MKFTSTDYLYLRKSRNSFSQVISLRHLSQHAGLPRQEHGRAEWSAASYVFYFALRERVALNICLSSTQF